MKTFILILVSHFFIANIALAIDTKSLHCEVFIDKIVPVKEHKSYENITYSKLHFFIKARKDLINEIKSVNFYSKETYFHYRGSTFRRWINTELVRIAPDYFKLVVTLDIHNHSIAKYSSTSIVRGNFNIQLKNGHTIWTHNKNQDIKISEKTLDLLPIPTKWINDGGYNLAQIPSVGNFREGAMSKYNLENCL